MRARQGWSLVLLSAFLTQTSLAGNQPIVKNNLTVVILLIVAISVSPGFFAWLRARRQARPARL